MTGVPGVAVEPDVDTVVVAVRACPGVDDLDGGAAGSVATYLPGRQIAGLRIADDRVTVQVRARWGMPFDALAAEVRTALLPLVGGRTVDIVVSDIVVPDRTDPEAAGSDVDAVR